MFQRLTAHVRGWRRRSEIDGEADEELHFHIERETEANVARGVPYAEARRAAMLDLGGMTQTRESIRAIRTIGIEQWTRDIRYASRALAATPRFTVVALLTIAVMVGGLTTIFSLVNGVLLRPLPYPDAGRIVIVESNQPSSFGTTVALSDALALQTHSRSFELWGLYRPGYVTTLDASHDALPVQDMRVTDGLFPLLGIDVVLGRPLLSSDADRNAPDVTVISYELWQTLFAGDHNVVGKTVIVRGTPFTVVGVTRKGADVPTNWLTYPILWRPVRVTEGTLRFTAIARLRQGVSVERGRAELALLADRLAAEHPETHTGRTAGVSLLLDEIVGSFKRVLWVFFGAVSCVVLIGVGNLTSLQLARNGARDREITLRKALGASRWRVVRQLVLESVLLCAVGGVLGFGLAWPAIEAIVAVLPPGFPRANQVAVDVWVGLFACAISVTVGVVVGMVPALQASQGQLVGRLNQGGLTTSVGSTRSRTQRALIAFQTAIALILLVGAGLLMNSLYRLMSRDAGMQEEGLWVAKATLPSHYRGDAAQTVFWTAALERARAVPGVESAAVAVNTAGPLSGGDISESGVLPEGDTTSPREGLRVSSRRVSDDYFRTLGVRLRKGRPILPSDVSGADAVVVINELAAAQLWPGADSIGKRLLSHGELRTVVGVIPTFRHARLQGDYAPQMYTSYLQQPSVASTSAILFRTAPGDHLAAAGVKSVLTALERDLRIDVSPMSSVRWKLLAVERFRVAVLLTFAGSAAFLALVGIVGLVAYTVGQRQREIAIRLALGANRLGILGAVSRQAILPAVVGLALGALGAAVATQLVASFLVDIQPIDLPTFGAALGLLAFGAVSAGLVPARRALKIDPVETLRSE